MNREELNTVLDSHILWLKGMGGERADLRNADLTCANLRNADLRRANLNGTNLAGANLNGADLNGAYLVGADLTEADLTEADLRFASLEDANLGFANLSGVDLRFANLRGAYLTKVNLSDTNLTSAKLNGANFTDVIATSSTMGYHLQCPEKGAFTAFKKCVSLDREPLIVELAIPEDAKRSSSTTRKCRASKAIVVSIEDMDGVKHQTAYSNFCDDFKYEVGKELVVDNFDDNRWKECSTGIHFFITRKEAVDYSWL